MNILLAPDSFKECIDSITVAKTIARGLKLANPLLNIKELPLADGGDGSLDILHHYIKMDILEIPVFDPLFRQVNAGYGIKNDTAYIEMAKSSGIHLVAPGERDVMPADSYGTGQLVRQAILRGAKKIVICLGGTATMDGGHGILRALGFRFLSAGGKELKPGCTELQLLNRVVYPENFREINDIHFTLFSDVDNPLLGEKGAARVFAGQKGASVEEIIQIEKNLEHFSLKIKELTGKDTSRFVGGGAAGGVPAGLSAFFDVEIQGGAENILEIAGFGKELQAADIVITAEGKLDAQTRDGKLPSVVAKKASERNVPVIFIGAQIPGAVSSDITDAFSAVFSVFPGPADLDESFANATLWLEREAFNIGKLLTLTGKFLS